MSKKMKKSKAGRKYTKGPVKKVKIVNDFLPPLEELIFKRELPSQKQESDYEENIEKSFENGEWRTVSDIDTEKNQMIESVKKTLSYNKDVKNKKK